MAAVAATLVDFRVALLAFALVLLVVAGLYYRGACLGLLLLMALNGTPGPSLDGRLPLGLRVQDGAVLLILLLALTFRGERALSFNRHAGRVGGWSVALSSWWGLEVVRSGVAEGIPIRNAGLYGRDFLMFALLVPALLRIRPTPRELKQFTAVILGGVFMFAIAQSYSSITHHVVEWAVHPVQTRELPGITRLYAHMNDLMTAMVPISVGLVLLGKTKRAVIWGWILLPLMTLSFLLQYTRASYFSLAVALVVVIGIWLARRDTAAARLRARTYALVVTSVLAIGLVPLSSSLSQSSTASAVTGRITTGLVDAQNRSGTYGYRLDVARRLRQVLGNQWLAGVGLLHPANHYDPNLPQGEIRNADSGFWSSLVPIGLVGTALLYVPLVAGFFALIRTRDREGSTLWLDFGVAVWLLSIAVGSRTLSTLFTVPGVVTVAFALAYARWLRPTELNGDGRTPSSREPLCV